MSEKKLENEDYVRPLAGIPLFIFLFFILSSKHLFFVFIPLLLSFIYYLLVTNLSSYLYAWENCKYLRRIFWVSLLFGGVIFIYSYLVSYLNSINLIVTIYSAFYIINMIFLIVYCKAR